jgi:hypothetical protein
VAKQQPAGWDTFGGFIHDFWFTASGLHERRFDLRSPFDCRKYDVVAAQQ